MKAIYIAQKKQKKTNIENHIYIKQFLCHKNDDTPLIQ